MATTSTAPQVGDLADHRSGDLDPRPVAAVRADGRGGKEVKLDIFGHPAPWLPASNYTFTRPRPASGLTPGGFCRQAS